MAKKATSSLDTYRGVDMGKLAKISGYATSKGKSEWVKFQDNEPLMLRLLPIHMVFPDLEFPGCEHVTHAKEPYPSPNPNWRVGDYTRQISCLRAHTEDSECPICELMEYLEEEGEEDSTTYKGIQPSKRILFNAVEVNPKTGRGEIKMLGMPGSVYNKFTRLGNRVGDVFDPKRGFNLIITREKIGRSPTTYSITTDPEGRSALKDIKDIDKWQSRVRDPREFVTVMDADEIKGILLENLPELPIAKIFDLRGPATSKKTTKKTAKKSSTDTKVKSGRGKAAQVEEEEDEVEEEQAPPRRSARSVVKKTARRGR